MRFLTIIPGLLFIAAPFLYVSPVLVIIHQVWRGDEFAPEALRFLSSHRFVAPLWLVCVAMISFGVALVILGSTRRATTRTRYIHRRRIDRRHTR